MGQSTEIMPLNVRPLSAELQEVARTELNEDPARIDQDLTHIREWLKKQPHIKARTDDQWLLTFLRGCKFSLERTKEKIDTYYTMRTVLPEMMGNRDPMRPEIQEILKIGLTLPLPKRDRYGRTVFFLRISPVDPARHKIQDSFKVFFMIMDILLMESDDLIINGAAAVYDCTGSTLAHMLQMTPAIAKKIITCFQEAFPVRPKSLNYLNFPIAFHGILNMVLNFMKDELRKRVFIHPNMESMQEQVPVDLLPTEYGGSAGSLDELTEYWKKKVESYRDWFIEEEQFKTNEKKRPGRPKTQETLFGLEGSFRQLAVD